MDFYGLWFYHKSNPALRRGSMASGLQQISNYGEKYKFKENYVVEILYYTSNML